MTINISNKYNAPYGVLSIDYEDPIVVNRHRYNSILHFMTKNGDRNFPLKQPFYLYQMWDKLQSEAIDIAIPEAIQAKSKYDPYFDQVLLTSETRPILYKSSDHYLGADLQTKAGENIYGKFLTSYRNTLISENSTVYYEVYVFNRYLTTAINYESLEKYLELSRRGYSIKILTKMLSDQYGKMIDIPDKEIIEETRAFTKQQFSYNSEEIILNVMKNKIRNVRNKNLQIFKMNIFEIFVKNVIKKYNLNYNEKDFIKKMELSERTYSIEKVFNGYTTEILHGDIQNIKPEIYIPSLEEVQKLENVEYVGVDDDLKMPNTNLYAIVDENSSKLSILNDDVTFMVENKTFPTIQHYIVYKICNHIIPNFEAYNLILNKEDGNFFTANNSKNFLKENLKIFQNHWLQTNITESFYARIEQHKYIKDYLKSSGDNISFKFNYWCPGIYNYLVNEYKNTIPWGEVLREKGNILDIVDTDPFFIFLQEEMFKSFHKTLTIATPGNFYYDNIINVYREFYNNVPGTIKKTIQNKLSLNNLKKLNYDIGSPYNDLCLRHLKNKFVDKFLKSENLVKILFNTNVIFMTKFLILESRYRVENDGFINPSLTYNKYNSKEYLALAKICNAIAVCNDIKIINEDIVDKAFNILTNSSNTYNKLNYIENTKNIIESNYNKIDNEFVYEEKNDETENDTDDEQEIAGYESDEDVDELVYGSETFKSADDLSRHIFQMYQINANVKKYIDQKATELYYSLEKNKYKINLYQ